MTEQQNMTQAAGQRAGLGYRSQLLMPVMEGNTLESGDVCSFLAGRLSVEDEEQEESDHSWAGFPVS